MKTKWIVIVIVFISLGVSVFVAWNMLSTKRNFTVLYNDTYNFCFLVDDRYQIQMGNTLTYRGVKSFGEINLINSDLSKNAQHIDINGFKGTYQKRKNERVYEYQISDSVILQDVFVNADKSIVNLVPYRDECHKIMTQFEKHQKIF